MKYYCTLFDSGYLDKGMVLIESLQEVDTDYCLFVLALDPVCETELKKLSYNNVDVISIMDFEDEELTKIKKQRSHKAYCWTCQASLPEYILRTKNVDHVIYMDADMYFYRSPGYLVKNVLDADCSVAVSPHNFANNYSGRYFEKLCGTYCSGFIVFINDKTGYDIAYWWRKQCIDECTDDPDGNNFGDQLYLEQWSTLFGRVLVIEDQSVGIGPWNIMNYIFKDGQIYLRKSMLKVEPLFYHFHGSKFISENEVILNIYARQGRIDRNVVEFFCRPYFYKIKEKKNWIIGEKMIKNEDNHTDQMPQSHDGLLQKLSKMLKNDFIYILITKWIIMIRTKEKDIMKL